ncbi:ERO1-like protein beta isoform X2 [Apostichopus japonicus]|uniref:ERO1-like protein beta isoform X2 n=1 Tax=Stichopus japonicus TaxID=307972 RepID=UPI003AB7254A
MQKYATVVCVVCTVLSALLVQLSQQEESLFKINNRSTVDPCFCELSGQVDDCDCKIESVLTFNNLHIKPRLTSLLERDYFKFYKINLNRPCPFWADDGSCAFESCAVCPCSEDMQWLDEIPCGLKEDHQEETLSDKYSLPLNTAKEDCEDRTTEEIRLSALDTTISQKDKAAFESWQEHDDAKMDFCEPQDEDPSNMEYVDLTINPERYTGYKGKSPRRIWNSIYRENCFKPDQEITGYQSFASKRFVKASQYLAGLCLEKRAFYRLISGLHSSINIHLCAKYLLSEGNLGQQVWGHNVEEFQRRFHPKNTKGEGPIRLKNLFFTYLVVLRAIDKVAPILKDEKFYSGIPNEDEDVRATVSNLLKVIRTFPNHFNESAMFQGDPLQAQQLLEEFRTHFRNVSRIMDCVGCDKCKLWGKLQTQGLGTALKILFTPATTRKPRRLKREEIVSLFNGFGRLSSSVKELEEFHQLIHEGKKDKKPAVRNGFF